MSESLDRFDGVLRRMIPVLMTGSSMACLPSQTVTGGYY